MIANQKFDVRFAILVGFIVVAAFSRIVPHMPNFSPLGAIGLFGAAHFQKKWQAFSVPIAATWLSDLFINNVLYAQYYPKFTWFYEGFQWQYGAYILIALAGFFILKRISVGRILCAALASTLIFFLVSNFGVWAGGTLYPKTGEGLLACYTAGIPFLKGTLLGDLVYSSGLFGLFAWAQQRFARLKVQKVNSLEY